MGIVPAVLVVQLLMMSITLSTDGGDRAFDAKVNPLLGPDAGLLLDYGAMSTLKAYGDGSVWRIVTAIFLVPGPLAWLVFPFVVPTAWRMEKRWGSLKMLLVGLAGSVSAIICGAIIVPRTTATAGATFFWLSMLGSFMYHASAWKPSAMDVSIGLTAERYVVLKAFMCLALGVFPFVGIMQSIFALLFGFLAAAVLLAPPLYNNRSRTACDAIWFAQSVSFLLVLGVLGCGTMMLIKKMDTSALCDGCYEYNCIDTDAWTCPIVVFGETKASPFPDARR